MEHSGDEQEQRLSLVVKACLGLLSSHIREVFPEKGKQVTTSVDTCNLCSYNNIYMYVYISFLHGCITVCDMLDTCLSVRSISLW